MQRTAILGVLLLTGVLAASPTTALDEAPCPSEEQVEAWYVAGTWDGVLTVHHAQGRHVAAFASDGCLVFEGPAEAPIWDVMCPHCGPDEFGVLLRVFIDGELVSVDRDDDWIWE